LQEEIYPKSKWCSFGTFC